GVTYALSVAVVADSGGSIYRRVAPALFSVRLVGCGPMRTAEPAPGSPGLSVCRPCPLREYTLTDAAEATCRACPGRGECAAVVDAGDVVPGAPANSTAALVAVAPGFWPDPAAGTILAC